MITEKPFSVLVTGGAGYIGSHAVLALRDAGWLVAVIDNLVSGFASPRLQERLDDIVAADGLIVVSPVFTASVSGLFKSFVDLIEPGPPPTFDHWELGISELGVSTDLH